MFRHVLCVYPYSHDITVSGRFPPVGLEMVARALEPHCREMDIIDLRLESKRTEDFLRPDTDLVCFSVNWDYEAGTVRGEILSVPKGILTVVGGRHATEDPVKWLSDCPNVDILVRGDGEDIAEEIARERPLEGIAGISYRLDGRLIHNPVRSCDPVRDDFYPNRRRRRHAYTLDTDMARSGLAFDAVASSRGCPFNCKFCALNRNPWGAKPPWTARSPESVVRELEEIDANLVVFVDDNFTHDMDRVAEICDLIVARGIKKRYIVNARLEIARRPDVLRKMERAGFSVLLLGVESAQDKTLRSYNKGFDRRQIREHFRVLRRSSMILSGYFILGSIGETEADMLQIAPFARELGLDTISLAMLYNARYSGLEELVARSPGYHVAPSGKIYSDDYSLAYLKRLRGRIYYRFFTLAHALHVLKKGLRNKLLTPGLLARLPWFILRKTKAHIRRNYMRPRR